LALATTALVVAGGERALGAGNGYFGYVGELTSTYDTNIGRLYSIDVDDVVVVASVEGRVGYRGEKNRLELSYRPLYEYFIDRQELNSFDQFARFGWSRAGSRSRSTAGASYGHTQDPRLALPPGVAPPPPGVDPGLSPFLLRRTHVDSLQGELGTEFDLGPHSTIGGSAAALELTFDDPTLFDSTTLDGGLEYAFRPGYRARWMLGYRYDRFEATRTPLLPLVATDTVLTLDGGEGGGDYRFTPTLTLDYRVGFVQEREDELAAIEGSDSIVGSVIIRNDRGPAEFVESPASHILGVPRRGWSGGYIRDYFGGSGLFTVARNDEFYFNYVHALGASANLSFRGAHTRSVQMVDPAPGDPIVPRVGASITSNMAMARYSRPFAEYWAVHTTAEFVEQTGEGVPLAQGTFHDLRLSLGITFSDEGKF